MPEGWAWCRLKEVCTVFGRIGFRGYTRDDLVEKGNGAITLSPSNLINMKLDLTDCTYISWPKYEESPEIQLDINDIVVVKTGSSYGKTSLVDNLTEKTTLNPQLMVLKERKCNSKYLCYFLNTQYMRKNFEDLVNGTAIPTFSQEKFGMKLFPLPPASEQEKIVSRIELIFDKIDLLENDKEDLDTIIKQTKSKILDLAIHGKLVPQNPNDEPAEELLKLIATSDNRPYKKFDKDDSPYTLPTNWAWCYLGDLCKISSAKRVLQQDWKDSGIPFYRAREIAQLSNNEKVKDDLFITPELYNELKSKYGVPSSGDLMISAVGTIGKIYIVKETDCFYYKDASVICFSKKEKNINSKFLKLCLESSFLQNQIYSQSTGTTVDTITINKAQEYLFPLPSIKEQSRIVSKIEELFSYLDNITINLV